MPRAERTVRRLDRWQRKIERHLAEAERRARADADRRPPVPRSASAPWGAGNEQVPGYGDPGF